MNCFVLFDYVRQNLKEDQVAALMRLFSTLLMVGIVLVFLLLTMSGTTKFSGRSMTLIDPTYAKTHMPLIASVAEHAPSSWANYFFDLNMIILFVPVGFYYTLVHKMTHGKLFIAMYGVFATYFSCVMNRLMLVLAPIACVLAAIAVAHIVSKATKSIRLTFIGKPADSPDA